MDKKSRVFFHISIRHLLLMLIDAVSLVGAALVAYFFLDRFQFNLQLNKLPYWIVGYIICGILGMAIFKAYRSFLTVDYIFDLAKSFSGFLIGEAVFIGFLSLTGNTKFIPFMLICTIVGTFILLVERIAYFLLVKKLTFMLNRSNYPSALIIGAGVAGRTVLSEIKRSKDHKYHVIGFVDDDENKISHYIDGIYVYGPTILIPELCAKHKIDELIFAIPTCPDDKKQKLLNICSATGCSVKIIPSLFELDGEKKFLPQIKSINVEDLLGRDVIKISDPHMADLINNRVVLVTGVGSIGSELCRQIVKFGPKKLVMVDIYENNAYDIQQELIRGGWGNIVSTEIASVRDYDKMKLLFTCYKPDIVFHAAAHKHVPLMEDNPEEAVKNNIFGTFNVARLCGEFDIRKMVLISTDKAVNPTNVMGATKRCCEMVMQYMAQQNNGCEYVAVRFGNVLGSNGSVIPLFAKQIESGGPVTVTHPDIIRYFMTIPEAVSLVLEAGSLAHGGEIFVLDMGEPVKITTLAENLIRLYGYQPYTEMPIKFTGLRPGEKLFEELLMSEEGLSETSNKKIFIGKQIDINGDEFMADLEKIRVAAANNDKENVTSLLHKIVPTFVTEQKTPANAKQ